jgi:hypothetical protein
MRGVYRGTCGLMVLVAAGAAAGCTKLNRNQQNAEQSGGTNAPMQTEAARDSAIPAPHGGPAPLDSDSVRSRAGGGVGGKGDETQERPGTGTAQNVPAGGSAANSQPTAAAPR